MPSHRQMLAMLRDREVVLGLLVLAALLVSFGLLLYVAGTL